MTVGHVSNVLETITVGHVSNVPGTTESCPTCSLRSPKGSSMQWVTYQSESGPRVAGVRGDVYVDLNRSDPAVPACIKHLVALGPDGVARAGRALAAGDPLPRQPLELLPPVPRPEKII